MKYTSRQKKKKNTGLKLWVFVVVFWCIGLVFWIRGSYYGEIFYPSNTTIQIQKGDWFSKFYSHIGGFQRLMMKLWMKNNSTLLPKLQQWTYTLSGSYTKSELMDLIAQWPTLDQQKVTLLEWWSIYDSDQYLTSQGFPAWSYIQKAQDQNFIQKMRSEFSFLAMLPEGKSLEWFLYPDTYFLDKQNVSVELLIQAQLKNFTQKVWDIYRDQFITFTPQWVNLQNYSALILASVIENEEKSLQNKPIIAWIFINRLQAGMRLDADVTLCYGLQIPYNQCRSAIPSHLEDQSNLYNTRKNIGLMPTPISSPSVETLQSLFNYQQTNALFYLHDSQWKIHYGATLEEHNQNKSLYL